MTDFPRLLGLLAEHAVDAILVGGMAATVHGAARLTQDIDVVYRRDEDNLRRLVVALAPLAPYPRGAPPGLPFVWDERTLSNGLNFTLTTVAGDIDLLGGITGGGDYEALLPHAIAIELFGARHLCLDLETLIRVKRAAGRPKDFESIAELEAIREEQRRQR